MGISSAKKLAELTHNAIGSRTIEAVEAGERVISTGNYAILELAVGVPVGTMEAVLRGELMGFPAEQPAGEPPVDDDRATYTRSEIRGIYRALGRDGFEEWVFRPSPSEGDFSSTG